MITKSYEILLVEDNPGDAELTTLALKEANVSNPVIHLKDGQQALDYIYATGTFANRIAENPPALILLDLKMPKVNGIEVLRKLKSDDHTKNIPVIVFTSSQEDPDVKECYSLGVNSYIVKPLEFQQFAKVVKDIGMYWLLINYIP